MINFRIEEMAPKFLLRDRTGRALAKGIEAALNAMCIIVGHGVAAITDVAAMPEWRLDELAWETNCLYDYGGDIENKRAWIRDALPLYRVHGTKFAITRYLSGFFDAIELDEWPAYNGQPFHFRVTVDGAWTPDNEAWARKAIDVSKNTRSVLDGLRIGGMCECGIMAESELLVRFDYPMTGQEEI